LSDGFELVPAGLPVVEQLGRVPSARRWLAELPQLIEQVREAFGLRFSAPLHGGSCSWVAPAQLADGTRVIVKIAWPHREMYGEPAALRLWDGRGAVRLLAHDARRHALILEPCVPGQELTDAAGTAEERLAVGCAVLRQLWDAPVPATHEIEHVAPVTAEWAELVCERMARLRPGYDAGLVAEGARLLRDLPGSARRDVLLHGDFNPGNVLSCGDGRWRAIDPKPMIGDPAYDPWPLLMQLGDPFAHPDAVPVLRARIGLVADELGIDPQRIVLWAVARTVEAALWAADNGDVASGAAGMREAGVLSDL
jgi:streptomycin 6-kinase